MSIFPGGQFPGTSIYNQLVGSIGAARAADAAIPPGAELEMLASPPLSPALRSAIDGLTFRHGIHSPDASPILAYRGWSISNGRLTSIGIGTVSWPTRRCFEAVCHRGASYGVGPHNAPHQDCQCGVYGFATPASLEQVFSSNVLGRVALGGEVVVCADTGTDEILGYRAESAYPSLLYTWDRASLAHYDSGARRHRNDEIQRMAAAYGVETAPLPDALLEQMRARQQAEQERARASGAWAAKQLAAQQAAHQAQLNGQITTSQAYAAQSSYLQQVYGGIAQTTGGTNTDVPYTPYDVSVARALGLHIASDAAAAMGLVAATPQSTSLHDALNAAARAAGMVK
jgi:hypothetical protein